MLTERLLRTFAPMRAPTDDVSTRQRFGLLEGWISVAVNLIVFVVKLVPGLAIGSVALVADAFHSLGDVASSAVVIWGFRASSRPSDERHPFGHGRLESVASLVIAVLLLVAALEFAKASIAALRDPRVVTATPVLLAVLIVTVVLKEWLARFSFALGRRIGSTALVADGWHHRSDVLATLVVVVALAAGQLGVAWIDGVAGLIVSAFLAWAGVGMIRESAHPLIGQAPAGALVERIRRVAAAVPGVDGVHDIIVHDYGGLVVTSLHIEVAADMDVVRGHEIAEEVEQALMADLSGWATVHVDPVNRDHPLYTAVETFLARHVPTIAEGASFHDLRIVGRASPCFVVFDLAAAGPPAAEQVLEIKKALRREFPTVAKVVINVEPRYVF